MKKILLILCILFSLISETKAQYLPAEISYVAHGASASDIPDQHIQLTKDGDDILIKYFNVIPVENWDYIEIYCRGYKTDNSLRLTVGIDVPEQGNAKPAYIRACSADAEMTTLYDIDVRIKDFSASEFLFSSRVLSYDFDSWKIAYPISLGDDSLIINQSDNDLDAYPDPTKLEWVLRNPKTKKIYRTRLGDKTEIITSKQHGLRIFTGRKFYLYESLEHNPETDPVIAYFQDFSGNFDYVSRLAADIEIPGDFWSSHLAGSTINPYGVLNEMGKDWIQEDVGLEEYHVTMEEASKSKNFPSKAYWWDLLQKQMRPIYAKEVKLWRENDKLLSSRIYYGEVDDHTYEAQWIHGLGPAGDNFASNLPYPVYDLPEGAVPTSLLYVRNFETNEIVWGDPTLDKEYMEAAGLAEIEDELPDTYTVYTASGICILKDGTRAQYDNLSKGLYIVNGKKILKK